METSVEEFLYDQGESKDPIKVHSFTSSKEGLSGLIEENARNGLVPIPIYTIAQIRTNAKIQSPLWEKNYFGYSGMYVCHEGRNSAGFYLCVVNGNVFNVKDYYSMPRNVDGYEQMGVLTRGKKNYYFDSIADFLAVSRNAHFLQDFPGYVVRVEKEELGDHSGRRSVVEQYDNHLIQIYYGGPDVTKELLDKWRNFRSQFRVGEVPNILPPKYLVRHFKSVHGHEFSKRWVSTNKQESEILPLITSHHDLFHFSDSREFIMPFCTSVDIESLHK